MILVIGATGTNGREVVRQLARADQPVRVMVRDTNKAADLAAPGVEVVAGDLGDVASIERALRGADRVFFVAPSVEAYGEWVANFLRAAQNVGGSPRVVKLSALGAAVDSPSELLRQHGQTDRLIADSGMPCTILRPNSFHQNLLWYADPIKAQGAFFLPMADGRQSHVDVRDNAAVAVKVLNEPGHEGKIYDLTGPEAITCDEIAEALSQATGRPIRYVAVPPEAAHRAMLDSGMDAWRARGVTELMGLFARGEAAGVTRDIEQVTGNPPIPFARFARDFALAFT